MNKACHFLLVPSQSSSMPLYPSIVLRARERAPTPYPSIVFSLGLTFESRKELWVRHNCIKSCRVRSTASKAGRCIIGASSQMIRSTLCTNSATFIYCVMLQVNSSCISIGILNLEWTVLLPKATKMQFLMRQLQAQYCLAFIDGIEALSKQMFCQFHHYHTHRTICHLCLSQHSK